MAVPHDIEGTPSIPGEVSVHIQVREHMGSGEAAEALESVAKVLNALLGRMLIGGAFQNAGATHPIAQQMFQAAAASGAAAMGINEQRRQLFMPGMVPSRGGRA